MTYKLVMYKYNISDAKAQFSKVMETVESGEAVVLCKRNKPVAQVVPISEALPQKKHTTRIGWAKGTVKIHEDLTEPAVPESEWDMLS